jgi:hypothetical protein
MGSALATPSVEQLESQTREAVEQLYTRDPVACERLVSMAQAHLSTLRNAAMQRSVRSARFSADQVTDLREVFELVARPSHPDSDQAGTAGGHHSIPMATWRRDARTCLVCEGAAAAPTTTTPVCCWCCYYCTTTTHGRPLAPRPTTTN